MIICKLAKVAKRKKLSLYRLRQMSRVSYPTLLKLAHNRSQMFDAAVLDRLCSALHCQPGDLLKSVPPRFPRLRARAK